MRIGLSYDLKMAITGQYAVDDALEEYDSPDTVGLITAAFESKGHEVVRLGGGEQFLDNVRHEKVDFVFNIAEGRGSYRSREAQIPSILEMLDIPYTGSDPQCLAVCLDKPVTKKLVAADGIITPKWLTVASEQELRCASWEDFPFPAIVKPSYEGSSKGIRLTSLVYNDKQAQNEAFRILDCYRQPVMIEEFVDGDEITVGIIGNNPPKIVGIMRVVPRNKNGHFIYSLEVKRDYLNLVDYECPACLGPATIGRLEESSLRVYKTLGCRDFARVDFRVSPDGIPYFIEINPLPGLGTYSDLIIMAKMIGWKHEEVINAVLDAAMERSSQCVHV
jgi:D-alanine-D-alanine ligase